MVSGDLTSIGSANWGLPGLVAPEAMTLTFSGMVATVGLPSPWGVFSSGGVVVRAHGVQTGQDTQSYTVSFSPLIPSSGSVTAYLVATITQIQQTPYPIPGPPPGHPAYNPNTIPTIGYAQQVYTTALAAVTGSVVDNINTFELMRTTLTAGQSSVTTWNTLGQFRVPDRDAWPAELLTSGGSLAPGQAQTTMVFTAPGITVTLPPASGAGGLMFGFSNPLTVTGTVATAGTDVIAGLTSTGGVTSVIVPASGAITLWANASYGQWEVVGFSPAVLLNSTNTWFNPNAFSSNVIVSGSITVNNGATIGGNATFTGSTVTIDGNLTVDGSETVDGQLEILGNTYFGSTGQFAAYQSGANQILQLSSGNYIEWLSGTGLEVVSTGSIQLSPQSGAGYMLFTGNEFTAINASLRASNGAYGSGDGNRCVLLGDYSSDLNQPGYIRLPSGLIIQWSQGLSSGANTYTVYYAITFPNALLVVVGCAVNSGPTYGAVTAFGNTSYFTAYMNTPSNIEYIAIGW